jgi:hypothetical protein
MEVYHLILFDQAQLAKRCSAVFFMLTTFGNWRLNHMNDSREQLERFYDCEAI